MKILGIVGSMRKDKFTGKMINLVLTRMKEIKPGLKTEILHISDLEIQPCRVTCSQYCSRHAYRCSLSDEMDEILNKMQAAKALVIGTPLYFRAPPAKFQALIERLISIFFYYESGGGREPSPLQGKPCGLIGIAEYANPHQILEYLNDFCTVLKMRPVVLDNFPYLGVGWQGEHGGAVFNPHERSLELAENLVKGISENH